MSDPRALAAFVERELAARANPEKAGPMQAYMKTDMPFYGVAKPERAPIVREIKRLYPPRSAAEFRRNVRALWELPHREEKYLAIAYARSFKQFLNFDQIDLFEQMMVEGAWWDLVDELASPIVSGILLRNRVAMRPVLERWIESPVMWLRRAAIICHNGHKDQTDWAQLSDFCLRRADEKEFFIRKAIGWALREYARANPEAVRRFLRDHRHQLSGLSQREAAKHLQLT